MAYSKKQPDFLLSIVCTLLFLSVFCTGKEIVLTIMQTTDLHGFMTRGDAPDAGGLLRLATLIDRERQRLPDDAELLIDCGDTITGTVESLPSRGGLILDMMQPMGYDVWVPGNHELEFGAPYMISLARKMKQQILCGNLSLHPKDDETVTFPAWRIIQKGDLRIAVIGMSASYTANWFWGRTRDSFTASSARESIIRNISAIRASQPDFMILAIHQGWRFNDLRGVNEIKAIAQKLPEIDLILGGHTHRPDPGHLINQHTWYVQAGQHANGLAVVRVAFDSRTRQVTSLTSHIIPATADVPPSAALQNAFAKGLEAARAFPVKKVGVLATPLLAGNFPGIDSETSECMSRAIAEAVNVPVVIHGKLSTVDFPAGEFSEEDLFTLVPYENTIGTLSLTSQQLKAVLNEQLANRKSYAVNGLWGLRAICEKNRVTSCVWPDGTDFSEGRITVAFHSYSLAGGGGRFPILAALAKDPQCQPVETGLYTRDIVRAYIKTHSPVSVTPEKWLIEK